MAISTHTFDDRDRFFKALDKMSSQSGSNTDIHAQLQTILKQQQKIIERLDYIERTLTKPKIMMGPK